MKNSRRFCYVPISVFSRVISCSCLLEQVLNDQGEVLTREWRNTDSGAAPVYMGFTHCFSVCVCVCVCTYVRTCVYMDISFSTFVLR